MGEQYNTSCWRYGRRRRRRQLSTILLLLVCAVRPSSGLFVHSAGSTRHEEYGFSAEVAAQAMNGIDFLKELVSLKSTSDETYYCHSLRHEQDSSESDQKVITTTPNSVASLRKYLPWECTTGAVSTPPTQALRVDESDGGEGNVRAIVVDPLSYASTCEYTGNLWFLPGNRGIRFRETVRVKNLSPRSSRVQCDTQYRKSGRWVECCTVTCTLSSSSEKRSKAGHGVDMTVSSKLLVSIPLPGAAGRVVRNKIVSSFESAAIRLFERV